MTAANPNGPRAKFIAASNKLRDDILLFLENYGPLTNEQLCELTGEDDVKIRSKVGRMKLVGLIHSEMIEAPDCPFVALYHLGPGEDKPLTGIRRKTVRKWKPNNKPDPYALPPAFFGTQTKGST